MDFGNIDGVRRVFGLQPDMRLTVFMFGLFHGFGRHRMNHCSPKALSAGTLAMIPPSLPVSPGGISS